MRHRRYRAIALLLGALVLGCDNGTAEPPVPATTAAPAPQAAGAEKAPDSGAARTGGAKAAAKTVSPLPTTGHAN
jgi:hypothetical protein